MMGGKGGWEGGLPINERKTDAEHTHAGNKCTQ